MRSNYKLPALAALEYDLAPANRCGADGRQDSECSERVAGPYGYVQFVRYFPCAQDIEHLEGHGVAEQGHEQEIDGVADQVEDAARASAQKLIGNIDA